MRRRGIIHETERGEVLHLVRHSKGKLVSISAASLMAGASEAAFLVSVSRVAFALSDGNETVRLLPGIDTSASGSLVVMLGLVMIRLAGTTVSNHISARLTAALVAELRESLVAASATADWEAQQTEQSGRLQELLTTYTASVSALLSGLTSGINSVAMLLAFVGSALFLAAIPALVVVAAAGVLSFFIRPIRMAVRRRSRHMASTGMAFATALSEFSTLGVEVRVFGVEDTAVERMNRMIQENSHATNRLLFLRGMVPALYSTLAYLALIVALSIVALTNLTDLETFGAVMLVLLRSLTYAQGLQAANVAVTSAMPFVTDLREELERLKASTAVPGTLEASNSAISIRSARYRYPGSSADALTGLDIEISANEMVGVVGQSGGGKSTLAQLLVRLRRPTGGVVSVGGKNLNALSNAGLRRSIAYVPQEPQLFSGTLAENIRFYRDYITDADVARAAQSASLGTENLPWDNGLEHHVGERGGGLSGGQRQRVTIARALASNPSVLIMDEPTSALDSETETSIYETLRSLHASRTIIVISHRMSTLRVCDRIVVIRDGRVTEIGTPDEISGRDPGFKQAWGMVDQ